MIESVGRVTLTWPTTGTAAVPYGGTGPSLAEIETAFTDWLAEARGRGCPDTAPVGRDRMLGDVAGLVVQWEAADSITDRDLDPVTADGMTADIKADTAEGRVIAYEWTDPATGTKNVFDPRDIKIVLEAGLT